jgi:hypothetical protein
MAYREGCVLAAVINHGFRAWNMVTPGTMDAD